jgi:hypothetical protein
MAVNSTPLRRETWWEEIIVFGIERQIAKVGPGIASVRRAS